MRRLGGAVRYAIVGGITLAPALRRLAVSQTSRDRAAARHPQAPALRRVRVPRRPLPVRPLPFLPPRWLAPLLARHHRRRACLNQGDTLFTPEAFPQLSPQACAVLNTPVKECDPKTLALLVSAFTQHISEVMSPEAGITDPAAALPNLWHRLNTALGDAKADTSAPATPEAVPATPADAVPDAPAASTQPPVHAPPTRPIMPSAKDTPRLSPLPLSGSPASDPPADAAITAPAPQATPDIDAPSTPVGYASRPLFNWDFPCCHPLFPRSVCDRLKCLPPPWRLYYAACTGPR